MLLLLFPASMFAAETDAAMLYTNGAAWVNGGYVPRASSAIFVGDLLQTRSDSVASINSAGSSITVIADSLVQFEGSAMKIEHGGVTISTSKAVAATAGDVKIIPASDSWTEFSVTDLDGTVRIVARKGDLLIDDGASKATLPQGQQTTRDENSDQSSSGQSGKKKNQKQSQGAPAAAGGGALNSPLAIGIGGGAVLGVATWVLVKSSQPASPSAPN